MWLAFLLSKWDRKECSIHRKQKVNITLWNFCFRYMRVSYMHWVMMTMWFLTEDRTKNTGRQLYDLQLIRDSSPRKYCESLKVRTLWRHFTYYFSKPWAWSWHLTLLQHSHWWGGGESNGSSLCWAYTRCFHNRPLFRPVSATLKNCYYHPCFTSREKKSYYNFFF